MKQDFLFVLQTYLLGLVAERQMSSHEGLRIAAEATKLNFKDVEVKDMIYLVGCYVQWERGIAEKPHWVNYE